MANSRNNLPPFATKLRHLLHRLDVSGLFAFLSVDYVKRNTLVFGQGFKAIPLNCGKMGKEIIPAAIGRNESKTFGVVKPFHSASSH
jgi:hypothetical protein